MRGAHRGVSCSKVPPLIEAELFAAERRRPAPSGRALLCAAPYARKIQGLTASQNLPDARNRAPAPPFRRATEGSRGAKEGLGESRGGKGTIRCPCPLLPLPVGTGAPAAGRRQCPACPSAVSLQRRTAVSAEINPLLRVKKKERRMACRPQTVKRKTHRLSPVRSGVTQTPFESGSYKPPCRRRWRAGCCASRRAALRSARCTAARERRACRSPSRHS